MMLKDNEKTMLMLMLTSPFWPSVSKGDVAAAIKWAEDIINAGSESDRGFVELVLKGTTSLDIRGDEPLFALTPKGMKAVEALIKENSN
jgi:hypothetical protein